MKCYAGTSGFSFKEWHGSFYPAELKESERLGFYSTRLNAVEINNTFYRLPKREQLKSWASQTPESFRFVIKAPRRITHQKRLLDADEPMGYLLKNFLTLGSRLGAVLFQLPPNMRYQADRFDNFLALTSKDVPMAFEFRHESWRDEAVFERLRSHNAAWVVGDEELNSGPILTADWSYLRLKRTDYEQDDVPGLAESFQTSLNPTSGYTFFKHENAQAPELARHFADCLIPSEVRAS